MANEKRLIDANALKSNLEAHRNMFIEAWGSFSQMPTIDKVSVDTIDTCIADVINAPTVDAVEVEKYKALLDMYHDLRDNFIDYYCSGTQNVAPYCLNKCEECVDKWGYCKQYSDHCKGFNPAEVII